jgi:hypothetical protein
MKERVRESGKSKKIVIKIERERERERSKEREKRVITNVPGRKNK